ncbi:MAG: tRNA (adenosine(37)-N6)-threonylcarbamoyltransferase complex ATPase subunit type 1 TsaE [Deltaproteobacteria bacterium]|jgi:tRNA threonylcarbamoyladenosine biosynthesis protein TsaE|nr:tRNA (adenosine(37)-N6)-threonylcarbamoyltransferase complex ATPase subunit type 1 TsaE [Deltaproteobacteria bacterium]
MKNSVTICNSIDETHLLAEQIMRQLKGGEIIGLTGELGAGKTEFVRGLAKTIGAMEDVSSPSFILQNIYRSSSQNKIDTIYHWDLYRVAASVDLAEILEGKKKTNSLTLIEWFEKSPFLNKSLDLIIEIKILEPTKTVVPNPTTVLWHDACIRQFTIRQEHRVCRC